MLGPTLKAAAATENRFSVENVRCPPPHLVLLSPHRTSFKYTHFSTIHSVYSTIWSEVVKMLFFSTKPELIQTFRRAGLIKYFFSHFLFSSFQIIIFLAHLNSPNQKASTGSCIVECWVHFFLLNTQIWFKTIKKWSHS